MSKDILLLVKEKENLFSHYYSNYEKHLVKGNLSKASEFLWGAMCSLIYSIALTYGEKLGSHTKMKLFAKRLSEETDDSEIYEAFKFGENLHSNFYHNFLDIEGLKIIEKKILVLIEKLQEILSKKIKEREDYALED